MEDVGLLKQALPPCKLCFNAIHSRSRLRNDPGGAHRRARVRDFQILCCAELEAPQPPRTGSAVVHHREGVCAIGRRS